MRIAILLLILAFLSVQAASAAIQISCGKWEVSCNMKSDTNLCIRLLQMENASETKEKLSRLREIRKDKSLLGKVMDDGEPLNLVFDSLELSYREDLEGASALLAELARKKIEEYALVAKGRRSQAYKELYTRISRFLRKEKKYAELIKNVMEVAIYDAYDELLIRYLIGELERYPECAGVLTEFTKEYRRAGGTISPELGLYIILASKNDNGTKLDMACQWINRNRLYEAGKLVEALPKITALVSKEDKEGARKYYCCLSNLALQQPSRDERVIVVVAALDERAKVAFY